MQIDFFSICFNYRLGLLCLRKTIGFIMQSQFLSHHNLHFKPFSARLGSACLFARTELQQRADRTQWHGRAMVDLSKATTIIGAAIVIPIALIEMAAAFAIASLLTLINKFICMNRSDFFQKYTLMSHSYGLHGLATCALAVAALIKPPTYHYHTLNMVGDRLLHYGTAGFAQAVIGAGYDRMAGRHREAGGSQYGVERAANLLVDNQRELIHDAIDAIRRDFGSDLRNLEIPVIQDFLNRHEEYRPLLNNPLQTLQNQRPQWIAMVRDFLQEAGVMVPQAGADGIFELAGRNDQENQYQTNLQRIVKRSLTEIHDNPEFAASISPVVGTAADGQQLILDNDASIYIPLANYVQYQELLEHENTCPDEFQTNDLRALNDRREKIEALKTELSSINPRTGNAFSQDMRDVLVKMLLNPDRFDLDGEFFDEDDKEKIREIFRGITRLSGSLHQGKLLSRLVVDLNAADGQMVTSVNYFFKACQEAVTEIEARPLL